jgi:butyryl-CoA dehydrogenase
LPGGTLVRKIHTKRYEKQVPGHQIQVDVKFLKFDGKDGKPVKRYQYIAIDDDALKAVVSYAKERRIGGRPIAELQGLQWMLADCANHLAAARALGLAAARLRGGKQRHAKEGAHAKLFASEAAWRIADRALKIHGGYSHCRDYPLERYFRDLLVFRIYEGSSELRRTIISRDRIGPS